MGLADKLVAATRHRDAATRLRAAALLGDVGGTRALPALARVATERGTDVFTLVAAIRALGKLRELAARPVLVALAGHASPRVRREAAEALASVRSRVGD